MKVLAISHFYIEENRAGGEVMLHRLLRELAKNHEVHMLVTDTEREDSVIEGVRVHYSRPPMAIANQLRPDIIITQFQNTVIAKGIARARKIPCVTIVHNNMMATKRNAQDNNIRNLLVFNTNWI